MDDQGRKLELLHHPHHLEKRPVQSRFHPLLDRIVQLGELLAGVIEILRDRVAQVQAGRLGIPPVEGLEPLLVLAMKQPGKTRHHVVRTVRIQ